MKKFAVFALLVFTVILFSGCVSIQSITSPLKIVSASAESYYEYGNLNTEFEIVVYNSSNKTIKGQTVRVWAFDDLWQPMKIYGNDYLDKTTPPERATAIGPGEFHTIRFYVLADEPSYYAKAEALSCNFTD